VTRPLLEALTLVVPCYNEAKRFDAAKFSEALARFPGLQLLLVNDGSSDTTASVIEAFAAGAAERVRTLSLPENRGKAEAVRAGLQAAMDDGVGWIGFWDADLATPLDALAEFSDAALRHSGARALLGSRVRLLGRQIDRNPVRHVLGRIFATAASATLDLPVYDTQCGAKIFLADETLRSVLREPFASRWIFDVELLQRLDAAWLRTTGLRATAYLVEVPLLAWQDVKGSSVRGRDFVRAGAELALIRSRRAR
jgi:glycosyltransferase involved in cell wall biosynthesis